MHPDGPSYEVITFDCYGTLIDWETGISTAVAAAASAAGVELGREDILQVHAEVEPAVQRGVHRSYREVLELVALAAAERLGFPLAPSSSSFLPESLPGWPAFPDTNPALERLRAAGLRLGILSNVDNDLLAGTLRHFTIDFDFVVTAQQVRSYKPAAPHFLRARELIGEARWLHVAQSYFHDVEPACALDIPVAWVNRKAESPTGSARPVVDLETLGELVHWLEAPPPRQIDGAVPGGGD
jgi:2-haloalkanoic acid dehalogenase type II